MPGRGRGVRGEGRGVRGAAGIDVRVERGEKIGRVCVCGCVFVRKMDGRVGRGDKARERKGSTEWERREAPTDRRGGRE
jgi:hypothetical protein